MLSRDILHILNESAHLVESKLTDYISAEDLDKALKANSSLKNILKSYQVLDNMMIEVTSEDGVSYFKAILNDDGEIELYRASKDGEQEGECFPLLESDKLQNVNNQAGDVYANDTDKVMDNINSKKQSDKGTMIKTSKTKSSDKVKFPFDDKPEKSDSKLIKESASEEDVENALDSLNVDDMVYSGDEYVVAHKYMRDTTSFMWTEEGCKCDPEKVSEICKKYNIDENEISIKNVESIINEQMEIARKYRDEYLPEYDRAKEVAKELVSNGKEYNYDPKNDDISGELLAKVCNKLNIKEVPSVTVVEQAIDNIWE